RAELSGNSRKIAGGPYRNRIATPRLRRPRKVVRADGAAVPFKIVEPDGAYNTNHGVPLGVLVDFQQVVDVLRLIHAFADRVLPGPETLRQSLIDNHYSGSFVIIAFGEEAAAHQGEIHRLKIAGRNVDLARRDNGFAGFHYIAFSKDHAVTVVPAERNIRGGACRNDTGDLAGRTKQLTRERAKLIIL